MSFVRVNGGVVHDRDENPRAAPTLAVIDALGTDFRIWRGLVSIADPTPDRRFTADYRARRTADPAGWCAMATSRLAGR